ncbi:MAG: PD-(D/E)XK nuclease family protein [Clostridia bacterium]|nr:PD-(D/E)XK nuclease family protein [Clostridia bacterium]
MLRLITGRISGGKTTRIYEKIKSMVNKDESVMLIVPEQYSFKTEKMMLEMLGPQGADKVEVQSFSFLAEKLLKKYGLNSQPRLDDSTRALMMSLALEGVKDSLNIYGKHRYSAAVITGMVKTVKELRQCSVSAQMLRDASLKLENGILKSKVDELSLIMEAYTSIVERSYFDEECALDALCDVADEYKEFKGKTVFFDGFRGFTSQQLNVMKRIIVQSEEVYITLCVDRDSGGNDFSSFAHTKRTLRKILRLANEADVAVAPFELADDFVEKRYTNPELSALEKSLFEDEYEPYNEQTKNITICSAEDFESECDFVAHTVKKLIRTEGLRCRDIAIISRSENNYTRQLRAALKKNGVPVFDDRRQPIATQPLVEFLLSAVDIAVNGFSCDSVMRLLKTGLTNLSVEEISELENYALMWQINGNKWLEEWTAHPEGLGEKMLEKDFVKLDKINLSRKAAVEELQRLRLALKACNGLSAAEAVYNLFVRMNVPENLKCLAQQLYEKGETDLANEQERIWDVVIEILDRIASSLEEVTLQPKRFSELLSLVVSMYSIGNVPQGIDEIVIGSADRVKTTAPKVVFAVGVNDGLFPMIPAANGILSDDDRKILSELELKMDDNFEEKMMEERFIAYNTLCSPSDKLFVTFSRKDVTGAQLSQSELVTQIMRIFPKVTFVDTVVTPEIDFVEGDASAFELMAKLTPKGGVMKKTLEKYFSSRDDYKDRLSSLKRAVKKEDFIIEDKNIAKKLFGMNMYMSASRVEVFHKCPFQYFCKYGLNAKPRKVAELDPMQKGTAIHYILENLISIYGSEGICAMSKEQRDKCVVDMLEDYFNEFLVPGENMGERFVYLYRRLGFVICEVVDRLVEEFSVSEFEPVAFELKIDNDAEIPAYEIPLSDGGILKIKGSIDRVDVMTQGDESFVRVVDYKSGGKKFDLNEVFSGLNMQMLIYLFAIWRSGFRDYKNIKPAGVLYMPVNAPFVNAGRDEDEVDIKAEKQKSAKMSGMILDDSRVIYAMDSRLSGNIVPAYVKKDGENSGTLISLKQMGLLMKKVEKILEDMALSLHNGEICVRPSYSKSTASPYNDVCQYCDYKEVCGLDDDTKKNEIDKLKHEESLAELGGEDDA